jgi:hypothetical protein
MKKLTRLTLASALTILVPAVAARQSFDYSQGMFGQNDSRTTLVIKSDGSCALTNESVQPRKSLEMQISARARYSKLSGNPDDEGDEPTPPPSQATKPDQKPLTNEELAAKIREMYRQRPDSEEDEATKIDTVEVATNSVRIVTTHAFASVKELLSQGPYSWGPTVLMFEDAVMELDTNHNLRITFTANPAAGRYAKNMSRQWKSAKMKFDWKLVLPGKILTSGLPNTQGNTTWLNLDSDKPDTIDSAIKLIGGPLVITAEPGGLKLDGPLESKKLVQAAWKQHKSEPDLPITEAGAGFLAEPVSISLSTVHYFPEGEKYFKNRPEAMMLGLGATGTVVTAKIFPPKGRELRSVSDARVKAAKDDKARVIPAISEADEEQEDYSSSMTYSSNGSDNNSAISIQLRIALPAPDAKAIDEMEGEAVAVTVGGWKEMMLTNVQADAKKEIDLGEILSGAKLTVKKISGRKPQKRVEATLDGPKEVGQIEVKVKLSSRQGGQSDMNARRTKTSGTKTTRDITINAYEFENGGDADGAPLNLIIRYPQDMKRERVHFKLTGLDLL